MFCHFCQHAAVDNSVNLKASSDSDLSFGISAKRFLTTDLRLTLFVPSGQRCNFMSPVVRSHDQGLWVRFGQRCAHTNPCCQTSCHYLYQNNLTGHKSLPLDNECPVKFSRAGFGPFGGGTGHIYVVGGLNEGLG